jgi:hypothetical protein
LVTEGKYFGVQCRTRLNGLPNRRKERENDRRHGIGNLYPAPHKFNWFNQNGVFGRDSFTVHAAEEEADATAVWHFLA